MVLLRVVLAGFLLVLTIVGCGKTEPPATPTNVQATVGADGRVTVTWDASSGADYYAVFRGGSAGIADKVLMAAYVSGTSYVDNPTFVGNGYYQVTAYNDGGRSEHSADVSASGSFVLSETLNVLGWNLVSGGYNATTTAATSYQLYRADDMAMSVNKIAVTELSAGAYYYQVVATALNDAGATVTIPSNSIAVTYLLLTVASDNSFSWNPIAGASSYELYRDVTSVMTSETLVATSVSTGAVAEVGLTGTYYYRVKALDASNNVLETSFVQTVTYP